MRHHLPIPPQRNASRVSGLVSPRGPEGSAGVDAMRMRRNYVDGHLEACAVKRQRKAIERLLPQDGTNHSGNMDKGPVQWCEQLQVARRAGGLSCSLPQPFPQELNREIPMSEDRLIDIETKLAYQEDLIESLNQIVSDQQRQIRELETACRKMVDRLVDLSEAFAATQVEDAPPPHY